MKAKPIDLQKASKITQDYFIKLYGHLGRASFVVHSISRTAEGEPWTIICEVHTTPHGGLTAYEMKISPTGEIVLIKTIKDKKHKGEMK